MTARRTILAVDIEGTSVKVYLSRDKEARKFASSPKLTPRKMVAGVEAVTKDWKYDAVSIGYPGVVRKGRIADDPVNLGQGWVGFSFRRAFRRPVRIVNDAVMQALGSYQGGTMLFLGRSRWRKVVAEVVAEFVAASLVDDVVLGVGNVKKLTRLPKACRVGSKTNAFIGGLRLWEERER